MNGTNEADHSSVTRRTYSVTVNCNAPTDQDADDQRVEHTVEAQVLGTPKRFDVSGTVGGSNVVNELPSQMQRTVCRVTLDGATDGSRSKLINH